MPLPDYALVVGINNYPGIGQLSGAEHDAEAFYAWVTDKAGGGVDPANAIKIVSSAYPLAPDASTAEPDTKAIEGFFERVDEAAGANNDANKGFVAGHRLWMFFSGHGFAPSLDRSGVLTANATLRRVHNIAARLWADRLYEGGWFDEVILFQDACRSRIVNAELNLPFLSQRGAPRAQVRRRFYAFAASNDKIAKEVTLPDGKTGGAFTATLLDGLRGHARDPQTGIISTAQLRAYLKDNMKNLLTPDDLKDVDVAKEPDVFDPDTFDIVPATGVAPSYPVLVVPSRKGQTGRVFSSDLALIVEVTPLPQPWTLQLLKGLYKAVVDGVGESLFEVTGAVDPAGAPSLVEVHV